MRPISTEVREKLVSVFSEGGITYRSLAKRFSVSYAACYQIIKRHRTTGTVRAFPFNKGHRAKLGKEERERLRDLVVSNPDFTLRELADQINAEFEVDAHPSAIHRTLSSLGFTRNKKPCSL